MPTSVYTLYDSEFIQRINYPAPQQLSEFEGSPGIISRQCLSCHDGTVAIGAVYIVRGTELGNTVIQMQNVNPDGTLPSTLRTFIGTDLSVHHPVAVEYNPSIQVTFADGTVKTAELAKTMKNGKPKMIIANTVKGKGVSFMENNVGFHGKAPNNEELEKALTELQ